MILVLTIDEKNGAVLVDLLPNLWVIDNRDPRGQIDLQEQIDRPDLKTMSQKAVRAWLSVENNILILNFIVDWRRNKSPGKPIGRPPRSTESSRGMIPYCFLCQIIPLTRVKEWNPARNHEGARDKKPRRTDEEDAKFSGNWRRAAADTK